MSYSCSRKKFALLVGVDAYLSKTPKKDIDGERLILPHLRGCVNDVHGLERVLSRTIRLNRLVKPTYTFNAAQPSIPLESPAHWPTFENIKRQFDTAHRELGDGDFFFFHFSGHGACLTPTRKPFVDPGPSLLTVDFNSGKPAVRGWQLNRWLEKLDEKGVRVVVSLDSCHSGGAWRDDGLPPGPFEHQKRGQSYPTWTSTEKLPTKTTTLTAFATPRWTSHGPSIPENSP